MAKTQLSDVIHLIFYIVLHASDENKSINTDPTMVRRVMLKLRKAKILGSAQGIASRKFCTH